MITIYIKEKIFKIKMGKLIEIEKRLKSLTEEDRKTLDKEIEKFFSRNPELRKDFLEKVYHAYYDETACEIAGADYREMNKEDQRKIIHFVYLTFFEKNM